MVDSKTNSRIIYLIFILSFSLSIHAQTIEDLSKYQIAYNYISKKYQGIKISGNIIDLDRWVFPVDSLKDFPKEKEKLEATVKRKRIARNEDYYSKELAALTPKSKEIKNIIYFSQVEDNMLVANLVPFEKHRHRIEDIDNFDSICRFTTTNDFLFIFDENNNIKKILTVEVNVE